MVNKLRAKFLDRCWEYMRCGEEITCAAYPDGGHECWFKAGTMRNTSAEKILDKLKMIAREQTRKLSNEEIAMLQQPTTAKKICKYVERYGMCQCCPFYKYIEGPGKR